MGFDVRMNMDRIWMGGQPKQKGKEGKKLSHS